MLRHVLPAPFCVDGSLWSIGCFVEAVYIDNRLMIHLVDSILHVCGWSATFHPRSLSPKVLHFRIESAPFDSDALGWLFGLPLIFGLPLVLLLGIGLVVGSLFNRASAEEDSRESAVQPAFDHGLGATLYSSPNQAPMPMEANGPPTAPRSTEAPRLPAAANRSSRSLEAHDVITCRHLRPIEHAMRLDGLEMRKENASRLNANCRIDLPKLDAVFGPAVAALYIERHEIDRSYLDPKSALFWCGACHCRLAVVHPEEAGPATPWFPRENPER